MALPGAGTDAMPRSQMPHETDPANSSSLHGPTWDEVTAVPAPTGVEPPTVDLEPAAAEARTVDRHDAPGSDEAPGETEPAPAAGARHPRVLGEYEILAEIARGGMGVVYRARQVKLGRIVALKLIRDPSLATEGDLRRFQIEAEAIALLDHPNIVPIFEVGQADDQPYFSMKLVEGGTLSGHLKRLREHPRAAAAMMVKVARAVAYAHQRAILHRDLKPSNILVDRHDEPYVTDFGLAKRIESGGSTAETLTGAVMGTPAYMPPEQARGGTKSLTTSADLYSLGATLYEMLTGRPPFVAGSVAEILRLVLDHEPARPRSLDPMIDRDLETICLKCLEKDPARRYRSAEELADDLENWLTRRPINARPASALERLSKWARRRPEIAALAATVLAVVVIGFAGVTWQWRNTAIANSRLTRSLYIADMQLGAQAFANNQFLRVEELLLAHTPGRAGGTDDLRGFEWHYLHAVCDPERMAIPAHKGAVEDVNFSPDGALFATPGMDKVVRLWETRTGRLLRTLEGHTHGVKTVGFDRDGARLASGGYDRTARIWEVATGRLVRTLGPFPVAVTSVAFSPTDGRTLVLASDDFSVRFVDPETGAERHREELPVSFPSAIGPTELSVMFNHAGTRLMATVGANGLNRSWLLDADTGRALPKVDGELDNPVEGTAFHSRIFTPGDARFLLLGRDGLQLHDARTARVVDRFVVQGHHEGPANIHVSERGDLVVTGSESDGLIRIWDLADRRELRTLTLPPYSGHLATLGLSPDGQTLAAASGSGRVFLWSNLLGRGKVSTRLFGSPRVMGAQSLHGLALDSTGRMLAVGGHDGRLTLGDVLGRSVVRTLIGPAVPIYGVAFSPDGRTIASAFADGHVRVWDTSDGRSIHDLTIGPGQALGVAFNPTGRRLAAGGDDGTLTVWDLPGGAVGFAIPRAHEAPIHGVAFSPDGSTLATAGGDQAVQLRDADTGRILRTLRRDPGTAPAGPFFSVAFSPDSRQAVAACTGGLALIWDAGAGGIPTRLIGHVGPVYSASFSPDGRRVVTAGEDGGVKIWDIALGKETLALRYTGPLAAVALTPDGFQLVAAGWDGVLTFWDARPVERVAGREAVRGTR